MPDAKGTQIQIAQSIIGDLVLKTLRHSRIDFTRLSLLTLVVIASIGAGIPRQIRAQTFAELNAVRDVRALTSEQAGRGQPVRLRGVVTALSGWRNSFFVQDSTAGISVDRTDNTDVQLGDKVEVTGTSNAGLFAPLVLASRVRVLGHASSPIARRVTYGDMMGGAQDSQWIEVEGVVHSARITTLFDREVLLLTVELGGGSIKVFLQDFSGIGYQSLIDATVHIRGVCSTEFNQKRQFVGLGMFVPDRRDIDVLQPADSDPFDVLTTPVHNALQFGQVPHRVKVEGVSTFQFPGHSLYIQDGNDGMRIQTSSEELVEPGTKVEAVGFPVMGEYAPILEDAFVRVIGKVKPITPLRVDAKDVITQQSGFNRTPYDQQLVQLQGTVVESHIQGGQRVWVLRQGSQSFDAYLPLFAAVDPIPNIGDGSILLFTGICTIQADFDRNPVSFAILVRALKDIVILKPASWWTASHAVWVVVILVLLLLGMAGWLGVVRRQAALRILTVTDPLTGLYNRRGFLLLAEQQWRLALRRKTPFLLFYIDVDHFKEINDSLGHREGDLTLQVVAELLRGCFRKTDIIGRLGGDEFAVTAFDAPLGSKALLKRRLAETLHRDNEKTGRTIQLSLSVGVLPCDKSLEALSIEELLVQADALMYQQKRTAK